MEINKQNLIILRKQLEEALAPVAAKNGLKLSMGRCTFDPKGIAAFKLDVSAIVGGAAVTREALDFPKLAAAYGLERADLGREFVIRGERYQVTGINSLSRKMPICGKRISTGQAFKFPAEAVIAALHGMEARNFYKEHGYGINFGNSGDLAAEQQG